MVKERMDLEKRQADAACLVPVGSSWRSRKTEKAHVVMTLCVMEGTGQIVVVHRANGELVNRCHPLEDFQQLFMELDTRKSRGFQLKKGKMA